jgi:excisionase family DNA binding protein
LIKSLPVETLNSYEQGWAIANMISNDPERLLDVAEAAVLLHVKAKTLYAWVSRDQIPYRKIRSLVRFHRGELIDWAKGQQNKQSTSRRKELVVVK